MITLLFTIESLALGVGLAMDAFSVSLANGLNEPRMKPKKALLIAGVFGIFQGIMPLIGWGLVHSFAQKFKAFEKFIPWIALVLLCFIGGKMLIEGIKCDDEHGECPCKRLTLPMLLTQGVATSIDALSVGFTIASHTFVPALVCIAIIATVTFGICFVGVNIGERVGAKFSNKASVLGGAILIIIGVEIFITGIF